MIPTIIILALALTWLMYETDFMRIRLETADYQKSKALQSKSKGIKDESNNIPLPKFEQCYCTKHKDNYPTWLLPARKIKAYGHSITLEKGCNICRAKLLKEVRKAQTENPRKPNFRPCQLPANAFIRQVRIGSHHEYERWNNETNEMEYSTKPKKGYYHRVIEDYTTKYDDCLCGKDWLKEHEKDEYPEPLIELSVNGKSLSVNGDYKKGMIANFMSEYTRKVRAGKKTMTITKGGQVANCGGGVYIAINK